MLKLSNWSGSNSVNIKQNMIVKIIQEWPPKEAKVVVRFLEKSLKIGAAEKTMIASLARAFAYTPWDKNNYPPEIINYRKLKGEHAFLTHQSNLEIAILEGLWEVPNYDMIIDSLLEFGLDAPSRMKEKWYMRVGIPVKPMLAKPTNGIDVIFKRFEGLKFTCEYKYDGFRGQIHFIRKPEEEKPHIEIFSRNLENLTPMYPDVISFLQDSVKKDIENFIIDWEIVAFWPLYRKILPFQMLTKRNKKKVDLKAVKSDVWLYLFDILYLNSKSLLKLSLKERRETMYSSFEPVDWKLAFASCKDADCFEDVSDFLDESIKNSWEGLMVKTLEEDSTYEPSKRSFKWLKLKKDYLETSKVGDSLDLVWVGADFGSGRNHGLWTSFLFAWYDEENDEFQWIAKAGAGFSDAQIKNIMDSGKDLVIDKPDKRIRVGDINADIWLQPNIIFEIKCADLTISPKYTAGYGKVEENKGISLRFPRFIRIRDDKTINEITTSDQVIQMYTSQESWKKTFNFKDEFDI